MTPEERQRNAALTAGICFFAGCIIVWAAMCAPGRLLADAGPLAPGDTCRVYVVAFDSTGIELLPDAAKVYIDYLDSRIDSLTYPSGGLSQVGAQNWLYGDYVVPSTWTHPYTLTFSSIWSGDGFTDDLGATIPSLVRVNARTAYVGVVDSAGVVAELTEEIAASAAVVDSLSPSALGDLWSGIASGTAAIIDTTDCAACGVYASGGAGVSDVPVYITRSSTFTAMSDVIGFTWSVDGFWRARVPAVAGVADTFYVWAYRQGSYQPSAAQVIVSE